MGGSAQRRRLEPPTGAPDGPVRVKQAAKVYNIRMKCYEIVIAVAAPAEMVGLGVAPAPEENECPTVIL